MKPKFAERSRPRHRRFSDTTDADFHTAR